MTNKTMPETICVNIDASGAPYIEDTSDGNCHIGFSYIRADLIDAYAFNDELQDGQQRWVFWRESWFLVRVSIRKDGSAHFSVGDNYCGASFNSDDPDVLEIGPVVRAPKHKPIGNVARHKDDSD